MTTNESAENYLETILILSKSLPVVRSVDICNELGFKKSSVSVAMKNLRNENYIEVNEAGYITLTEKGSLIAHNIYDRHTMLTDIFTAIGISSETAAKDACKIEHDLSSETIEALKKIHKKIKEQ